MLFDKFYLMNYQPPVEREVKCNGAQIKVPDKSVNVMVYYCFIVWLDFIPNIIEFKLRNRNLPILMWLVKLFAKPLERVVLYLDVICYKVPVQHSQGKLRIHEKGEMKI